MAEPTKDQTNVTDVADVTATTTTTTPATKEAPKFKGVPNIINLSKRRNVTFYMFLAKKIFPDYATVELHALEDAITTAVITAESLVRYGYATVNKIETMKVEVDSRNNRTAKRSKIRIVLARAPGFEEAVKKFESMREQNATEKEEQ